MFGSIYVYMGGCQNYGPSLGTLNIRCRIIIVIPEGTIILTTTHMTYLCIWGFPKIRGTFLAVPIVRTIVYWGLYWGPPILGNYHI